MSFILDALRKSDARRRQGGSPGLHTPEPVQSRRSPRRRWLLPVTIVGAVVLAAALSAVLLEPGWLPGRLAAPEPRTEVASETEPAGGGTVPEAPELETGIDERPVAREEAEPAPRRERRRVIPPPAQETGAGQASPTRERESEPVPADQVADELGRRLAEARVERGGQEDEKPGSPEGDVEQDHDRRSRQRNTAEPEPPGEAAQEPSPKPLEAGVAEYLRQWELPLSVRRSLPELNLSIHVYSPEPAERFVLVNGERHMEGDEIAAGVRLVDIRREGAVVDYRSHRFLLERR